MTDIGLPPKRPGIIESRNYPDFLQLHAVQLEPECCLHGYSLLNDLQPNYRRVECVLLAYLGELPTERQIEIFELAQSFVQLPLAVTADLHSSILAQVCGARAASIVMVATTSAAEDCERRLLGYGDALNLFAGGQFSKLEVEPAVAPEELSIATKFRQALDTAGSFSMTLPEVGCFALWLRAMAFIGVTSPIFLCAIWAEARLPTVLAEAAAAKIGSFKDYPINQPPIEFEAERQ
jgi:hypothetical protein